MDSHGTCKHLLADELEVGLAVFVAEEYVHRSHAALRDMVRLSGNCNECNPRRTAYSNRRPGQWQ